MKKTLTRDDLLERNKNIQFDLVKLQDFKISLHEVNKCSSIFFTDGDKTKIFKYRIDRKMITPNPR